MCSINIEKESTILVIVIVMSPNVVPRPPFFVPQQLASPFFTLLQLTVSMRIFVILLRVIVAINSKYEGNDDTDAAANDAVANDQGYC